jgi:hypothetical protein
MISINRLIKRKSDFAVNDWILDSGGYTRISSGKGHLPVEEYAEHVNRWSKNGNLLAAVSQDYTCDPLSLKQTGLTLLCHQKLTIQLYKQLRDTINKDIYLMPVIQGWEPEDYSTMLDLYGDDISLGSWVGVGTLCGRSKNPQTVLKILEAIHRKRPDLKLHGFGVKKYCLSNNDIKNLLWSSDSQAHSFGKEDNSRWSNSRHDPNNALAYYHSLNLL